MESYYEVSGLAIYLGRIYKHLKKMPKTKEYLSEVVEDTERFRQRRFLWAIQELKKEDESLTLNRLKIKAGVGGVDKFIREHPAEII